MSQLLAWGLMFGTGTVILVRYLRAIRLSEGWENETEGD